MFLRNLIPEIMQNFDWNLSKTKMGYCDKCVTDQTIKPDICKIANKIPCSMLIMQRIVIYLTPKKTKTNKKPMETHMHTVTHGKIKSLE